jgi:hypothetical protein
LRIVRILWSHGRIEHDLLAKEFISLRRSADSVLIIFAWPVYGLDNAAPVTFSQTMGIVVIVVGIIAAV